MRKDFDYKQKAFLCQTSAETHFWLSCCGIYLPYKNLKVINFGRWWFAGYLNSEAVLRSVVVYLYDLVFNSEY